MTTETSSRPRWRRLAPLAALIVAAIVVFAFDLDRYLTFAALRDHRDGLQRFTQNHLLLSLAIYAGVYALVVALSLPGGAVMTIAGGFLFGTWTSSAVTVMAATAGATVVFLAARSACGDILKSRAAPWLKRFEAGFERNAVSYLLMLRLIPLFPFFVVNIAPAFLGVRTPLYVTTTFFGIIPGTVVYASVGASLGALFDAGQDPDLAIIFKPEILLPLLALATLSFLPLMLRKLGVLRDRND